MAADDKAIRTTRMKKTTRTSWLRKFKITRRMKKTRKGDEDERYGEDEDHGRTMRTTRMMVMEMIMIFIALCLWRTVIKDSTVSVHPHDTVIKTYLKNNPPTANASATADTAPLPRY